MISLKELSNKYKVSKRTLHNYLKNMPGYIQPGKRNRIITTEQAKQIEIYLSAIKRN